MGEYRFEAEGENIEAEDFLNALADKACVGVHLLDCVIEEKVDIRKSGIVPDENGRFRIGKRVVCQRCTFKERAYFVNAKFDEGAYFKGAKFDEGAYFREAEFRGMADFSVAQFKGLANFNASQFRGLADFNASQFNEGVHFSVAQFRGIADFNASQFRGEAVFNASQFRGLASFKEAQFKGLANFNASQFRGEASFREAQFSGKADFSVAQFKELASFREAQFSGGVHFSVAQFKGLANFREAQFNKPAIFADVRYWSNIFPQYLRRTPTEFYIEDKDISTISSPHFKRYVADQQFIREFRRRHHVLALIWRWSSDYGRSFVLWAFWSVLFAFLFSLVYRIVFQDCFTFTPDSKQNISWWGFMYYSIVTFTTLGFGDIVPINHFWARFFVTLEVILGYVMLGGLISIFANKLARRS